MTVFCIPNVHLISVVGALWIIHTILTLIQKRRFYRKLVSQFPLNVSTLLTSQQPGPPHSFLWGHLKAFGEIHTLFPPNTHLQYVYSEMAKWYSLPDIWYLDLWPLGPGQVIVTSPEAAQEMATGNAFPPHKEVNWFLTRMLGPVSSLLSMVNYGRLSTIWLPLA
jgi:hypothetical protein